MKLYEHSMEVRVLGGLPLKAHVVIAPAEPDVGITSEYADDYWLTDSRGRRAEWAERRMKESDWDEIIGEVIDDANRERHNEMCEYGEWKREDRND